MERADHRKPGRQVAGPPVLAFAAETAGRRLHVDLHVGPEGRAAEVKRLTALGATRVLELVQTTDILAELSVSRLRAGQLVVGFAAETGDAAGTVLDHGRAKARRKGADLLVVNAVGGGRGFGTADNDVTILDGNGDVVAVAAGSKDDVAHAVWDAVLLRG